METRARSLCFFTQIFSDEHVVGYLLRARKAGLRPPIPECSGGGAILKSEL